MVYQPITPIIKFACDLWSTFVHLLSFKHSNISISRELGCSCLSNSGCLDLSGLNLTNCGGGGGGLVDLVHESSGAGIGLGSSGGGLVLRLN